MSNFAETFGAIFRDVFGEWPPKPRITKVVGGWVCRSLSGGTQGFGSTPEAAYRHWKCGPLVYGPNSEYEVSK